MEDLINIILSFICGAVLVFIIIITPMCLFNKYIATPNFGKAVKRPVKYNLWAGGCFVNIDGNNWIPCNKYIGIIKGESK